MNEVVVDVNKYVVPNVNQNQIDTIIFDKNNKTVYSTLLNITINNVVFFYDYEILFNSAKYTDESECNNIINKDINKLYRCEIIKTEDLFTWQIYYILKKYVNKILFIWVDDKWKKLIYNEHFEQIWSVYSSIKAYKINAKTGKYHIWEQIRYFTTDYPLLYCYIKDSDLKIYDSIHIKAKEIEIYKVNLHRKRKKVNQDHA